MRHFRILARVAPCLAVALVAPAWSIEAHAQVGFVPQPTPIADQLAIQMRTLAADPQNLSALIAAGEMSAQLDDHAAALQFFARAEKVAPRDPRIAAGRGAALVRMGRPGEALRRFAEAEAGGIPPLRYAADRGLAYDLIGQPRHAQVEYARAMASGDVDETIRRHAVSLAISGDRAEAEKLLDPLLRKSDRAAWRTKAFVQALTGDVPGAEKVATTMMPGFGTAYIPLFRRMGQIREPADRAFAAHLGEFTRTPARLADASMAPGLPTLPGRARQERVAVAAYQPPAPVVAQRETASERRAARRSRARRDRGVEVARKSPGFSQPSRASTRQVQTAGLQPSAGRRTPDPTPTPAPAPVAVAQVAPTPSPVAVANAASPSTPVPQRVIPASVPNSGERQLAALAAPSQPATSTALSVDSGAVLANDPVGRVASIAPAATPSENWSLTGRTVIPAAATPVPNAVVTRNGGLAPVGSLGINQPAAAAASPRRLSSNNEILAAIVGNIVVPASELGVGQPATAEKIEAKPAPAPVVPAAKPKPAPKKAEPPKKVEAKKPPADPVRHWVQVAGGANVRDLPKEWQKLVDKAPAALKGRSAWTTPLRQTNRLLTGPFKTPGEAQTFVNTLGKAGLSGFAFTNEAGQKIEKLPAR